MEKVLRNRKKHTQTYFFGGEFESSRSKTQVNPQISYRVLVGQPSAVDYLEPEVHLLAHQLLGTVHKHVVRLRVLFPLLVTGGNLQLNMDTMNFC